MEILRYLQTHLSPFQLSVVRLAIWLMILAVVFVPMERLFGLRKQRVGTLLQAVGLALPAAGVQVVPDRLAILADRQEAEALREDVRAVVLRQREHEVLGRKGANAGLMDNTQSVQGESHRRAHPFRLQAVTERLLKQRRVPDGAQKEVGHGRHACRQRVRGKVRSKTG